MAQAATSAIACVLALLLAGCMANSSSTTLAHSNDGAWDGTSHGSVDCQESTRLHGFVNTTAGALSLVVEDGNGEEVLRVLIDRSSEVHRDFTGGAGTWRLQAGGSGFAGSFKLTLDC